MISKESFDSIQKQLKLMSDEQLARMNFEIFVEASERATALTGKEIEELVQTALNKPS